MQPLAENGRVWVFNTMTATWGFVDPIPGSRYPEPRLYHAATSTAHPLHVTYDQLESRFDPIPGTRVHGTIFVHGGCPTKGRLGDVWAFDLASRTWTKFPDPPGPERGGPSLAYNSNHLYHYGGFDGNEELGGQP